MNQKIYWRLNSFKITSCNTRHVYLSLNVLFTWEVEVIGEAIHIQRKNNKESSTGKRYPSIYPKTSVFTAEAIKTKDKILVVSALYPSLSFSDLLGAIKLF